LGANDIYKNWKNKQLGAVTPKKNDYFVKRKAESLNQLTGSYVRKSYEQRQDRRFVPGNVHPQDYHTGGTFDEGGDDRRYRLNHHDDCGPLVGEPCT
jgi:hypothetical protein